MTNRVEATIPNQRYAFGVKKVHASIYPAKITVSTRWSKTYKMKDTFISYEVVEWTKKYAAKGRITKDCEKSIQEFFKNTLAGFEREKSTSNDELFDNLIDLTLLIFQKKQEAERLGKPLLILLGENHTSREALVIEYMAVAIACDLDIRSALIEFDEAALKSGDLERAIQGAAYLRQMNLENWAFFYSFVRLNQMQLIAADPHYSEVAEIRKKRDNWKFPACFSSYDLSKALLEKIQLEKDLNEAFKGPKRSMGINNVVLSTVESCIGQFGDLHLKHILKDPRSKNYVVLALSVGEKDEKRRSSTPWSLKGEGTPYAFDFVALQKKIIDYQRAVRLVLCALRAGIYPERKLITSEPELWPKLHEFIAMSATSKEIAKAFQETLQAQRDAPSRFESITVQMKCESDISFAMTLIDRMMKLQRELMMKGERVKCDIKTLDIPFELKRERNLHSKKLPC